MKPPFEITLASMSPRRRTLLALLDVPFTVDPSGVDESALSAPSPQEFAKLAAREKCLDVAKRLDGHLVIGSDTIVHFDEPHLGQTILGKPDGPEGAIKMLGTMSGQTHLVTTGLAISRPNGEVLVESETTYVQFRPLSQEEIKAYVATGEPLDKAGSYGVQGQGGQFIDHVDGDLQNVVGLPLRLLIKMVANDLPNLKMPDADALARACGRQG